MTKTGTLLNRWLAVICSIILMISLFAVPAFAEETTAGDTNTTAAEDDSTTVDEDDSTTADEDDSTTAEEGSTTADKNNANNQNNSNNQNNAPAGLSTEAIVWIVVGGVILVAAVVLCVKFRSKIVKGLRVYKSEFKKVSWLSWEQTRKSTIVVVIILLVCVAVICLLDYVLSTGLLALITQAFSFLP